MPPPDLPALPPPLPGRRKRSVLPVIFVMCGIVLVLFTVWMAWEISRGAKATQVVAQQKILQFDVSRELAWARRPGTKMPPEAVYRDAVKRVAEIHSVSPDQVRRDMEEVWRVAQQQSFIPGEKARAAFTSGRFAECVEETDRTLNSKGGWFDRFTPEVDTHATRSRALYVLGRSPEAVDSARAAVSVEQAKKNGTVYNAQEWLAWVLRDCERFEEAVAAYRDLLVTARAVEVLPGRRSAIATENLRFILDVKLKRPTEAEPFGRQFVEVQRSLHGEPSTQTAEARYALGELLLRLERVEESATELSSALEQQRTVLQPTHVDLGKTLLLLAKVRARQQRYDEARKLCTEGIEVYTAADGPEDEFVKEWQQWLKQLPAAPTPQP